MKPRAIACLNLGRLEASVTVFLVTAACTPPR